MFPQKDAIVLPEVPPPMTEGEVLLEHANIMRKLASDVASQHLTLMLVGDGSPMSNLVRDTVAAHRRSMEEAADQLQRLAREHRLRPAPRRTYRQLAARIVTCIGVGITITPFLLMALFWVMHEVAPPQRETAPIVEREQTSAIMKPGQGQTETMPDTETRGGNANETR